MSHKGGPALVPADTAAASHNDHPGTKRLRTATEDLQPSSITTSTTSSTTATTVEATSISPQALPTNLLDLIQRDVDREGYRIVLPFLTTKDRLQLSVCARDLMKYRLHLSSVKIVSPDLGTEAMKQGLIRLLSEQQAGPICLQVSYPPLISMLDGLRWQPCPRVKSLDLSTLQLNNEDGACLGRALSSGALRDLEELVLSRRSSQTSQLSLAGLSPIIIALGQGACPRLHQMIMANVSLEGAGGAGVAIANALESGHLRHLHELNLRQTYLGTEGPVVLARALQAGSCPDLRILNLAGCPLIPADGRALGMALRSGACPKLEALTVHISFRMGGECAVPLMEALEAGSCPHLRLLDLGGASMSAAGGAALSHAFLAGGCRKLRSLSLCTAFDDHMGMLAVLEAIKQGPCRELRDLNLSFMRIDEDLGRALGESLAAGACPLLEGLVLTGIERDGHQGFVHVARALELGACPKLKRLILLHLAVGQEGATALGHALESGALKDLDQLALADNDVAGDKVLPIMRALGSDKVPAMSSIFFSIPCVSDEAGPAMVETFRDGEWSHLEKLRLSKRELSAAALATLLMAGRPSKSRKAGAPDMVWEMTAVESFRWLIQALAQGAFPVLKEVAVEEHLLDGAGGGGLFDELQAAVGGRAHVRVVLVDVSPPVQSPPSS